MGRSHSFAETNEKTKCPFQIRSNFGGEEGERDGFSLGSGLCLLRRTVSSLFIAKVKIETSKIPQLKEFSLSYL